MSTTPVEPWFAKPTVDGVALGGSSRFLTTILTQEGTRDVTITYPGLIAAVIDQIVTGSAGLPVGSYDLLLRIDGLVSSDKADFVPVARDLKVLSSAPGYAKLGVGPTGTITLSIYHNEVQVGQVVFADGSSEGVITLNDDILLEAGDTIRIVTDAHSDAQVSDARIMFRTYGYIPEEEIPDPDPSDPDPPDDPPDPEDPEFPEHPPTIYTVEGDEDFNISNLSTTAQTWLNRLLAFKNTSNPSINYESRANSDNLYHYARDFHSFIQLLLFGLRVTGDLRLLDMVDHYMQMARSKLHDSWRDTLDGTTNSDGHPNWVWRQQQMVQFYGKDVHELDEAKSAAGVAMVAYAYEVNRNKTSPAGINYAERADFWKDWLVNHWVAKWRARKGFDAIEKMSAKGHALMSRVKLCYYLHRLTGDDYYMEAALRLNFNIQQGLRETEAPNGQPAFIWLRSWSALPSDSTYHAMPSVYGRYVIADAIEFYWEQFSFYSDPQTVAKFANTMAHLMLRSDGAERDVFGGVDREGWPASDPNKWNMRNVNNIQSDGYVLITAYDISNTSPATIEGIYDWRESNPEQPRRPFIPAAMLINDIVRGNPDDPINASGFSLDFDPENFG